MEVIKNSNRRGFSFWNPRIFNDARGYSLKSFSGREFEEKSMQDYICTG